MGINRSNICICTTTALSLALSLVVATFISCGGSSMSGIGPTTGTVRTFLSDPPTCSLDFNHVWVTITKVEANISATDNSGWQTLVDLTNNPQQVDLLSLNPTATPNFCGTLFMLGQKSLPPGKYQQIRLTLMANNASGSLSGNACTTGGFNCVIPRNLDGSDGAAVELQLSSQAQTGIKIPASQITNGGLTVTAGQSTDLNIDFQTCASIVREGNGQYRFKPVLHAGEVSTNTNSITGKVVEGAGSPNPGMGIPNAIVLLEQPDSGSPTPIDRVILSGLTASDGSFAFCPIASNASGNFDIVVAGTTTESTTTTTYNPSVVFGVPVGGSPGSIPLFAETNGGGSAGPAVISGQITTQGTGSTPVAGDVQVTATQSATNGSSTVLLTIPVLDKTSTPGGNLTDSQPPVYTTLATPTSACATASLDCVAYSLTLPASAVAVGSWDSNTGNNVVAPSSTNSATYTIEGLADGSMNSSLNTTLLTCTSSPAISSSINVTPGSSVGQTTQSSLTLALTGCTAP
ncbi:MAG TPA: DUF4382 domain-containing protein [Terriglobia bacterium]|nr:DUF4382 domain-containing protein [Terriglobia bacterium]